MHAGCREQSAGCGEQGAGRRVALLLRVEFMPRASDLRKRQLGGAPVPALPMGVFPVMERMCPWARPRATSSSLQSESVPTHLGKDFTECLNSLRIFLVSSYRIVGPSHVVASRRQKCLFPSPQVSLLFLFTLFPQIFLFRAVASSWGIFSCYFCCHLDNHITFLVVFCLETVFLFKKLLLRVQ